MGYSIGYNYKLSHPFEVTQILAVPRRFLMYMAHTGHYSGNTNWEDFARMILGNYTQGAHRNAAVGNTLHAAGIRGDAEKALRGS